MTDKLIILNKVDGCVKEGFFRFDKDKKVTVAFNGEAGKYVWVLGNNFGEFTKNHAYIPYSDSDNMGIFRIEGNFAYPVLIHGDEGKLKISFNKLTGYEIKRPEKEEVKAEVLTKKEEPAPYKETGYTVPDDFLPAIDQAPETFWDCNKEKFTSYLEDNPINESLGAIIPGSRWADISEENYTFGVIYDDNGLPLYIAYGFRLGYSDQPPESLDGYSQWIPTDTNDPHGDGFWVIYINAVTGERIN